MSLNESPISIRTEICVELQVTPELEPTQRIGSADTLELDTKLKSADHRLTIYPPRIVRRSRRRKSAFRLESALILLLVCFELVLAISLLVFAYSMFLRM